MVDKLYSAENLNAEIDRLRDIVQESGDPYLSGVLIAVSDPRVQTLLLQKLSQGHDYVGALSERDSENPERRLHVRFEFARGSGSFGLIPLSFLTLVDTNDRAVLRVVDPYISNRDEAQPATVDKIVALRELDLAPFMIEGSPGKIRGTQRAGNADGGSSGRWVQPRPDYHTNT